MLLPGTTRLSSFVRHLPEVIAFDRVEPRPAPCSVVSRGDCVPKDVRVVVVLACPGRYSRHVDLRAEVCVEVARDLLDHLVL